MKKIFVAFVFVLILGISLWNPLVIIAAEHGGTTVEEHGGSTMEEHGGTAMEEAHTHAEDTAATIREAASILRASHPELAAKLEIIAEEEGKE